MLAWIQRSFTQLAQHVYLHKATRWFLLCSLSQCSLSHHVLIHTIPESPASLGSCFSRGRRVRARKAPLCQQGSTHLHTTQRKHFLAVHTYWCSIWKFKCPVNQSLNQEWSTLHVAWSWNNKWVHVEALDSFLSLLVWRLWVAFSQVIVQVEEIVLNAKELSLPPPHPSQCAPSSPSTLQSRFGSGVQREKGAGKCCCVSRSFACWIQP